MLPDQPGWSSPSRHLEDASWWRPSTPDGDARVRAQRPDDPGRRDREPGTRHGFAGARSSCTRSRPAAGAPSEPDDALARRDDRSSVPAHRPAAAARPPPGARGRRARGRAGVRRRCRHDRDRRTVVTCTTDGAAMTVTVDRRRWPAPSARRASLVLANVAVATHGESVAQVLGSGDGRRRLRQCSARAARR